MKNNPWKLLVLLRWIVGLIFIVSGSEKLLSPVGNFIYAIESYQLIPFPIVVKLIAYTFPWVELFVGLFMLLGLWIRPALLMVAAVSSGFICFVGQAMLRQLPLVDCGCFGDLAHFPIWVTFALDWFLLLSAGLLYWKIEFTRALSLDLAFD